MLPSRRMNLGTSLLMCEEVEERAERERHQKEKSNLKTHQKQTEEFIKYPINI